MNEQMTHDRQLADWLEAAGPRTLRLEVLDAALDDARSTSQRGRIASWLAGPSPWPRVGAAGRIGRLSPGARLVLVAILTLSLVASAIVVGGRLLSGPAPDASVPLPTVVDPTARPSFSAAAAHAFVVTHASARDCVLPGGGTTQLPAISRVDLASGVVRPLGDCLSEPLLSPDGLRAVSVQGDRLQVIDVRTGLGQALAGTTGPFPGPIAWSPNGTYLHWLPDQSAAGSMDVFVGPLDDVRRSRLPGPAEGGYFTGAMWSADESTALFQSPDGTGWVLGSGDGTNLRPAPELGDRPFGISPDGSQIAVGLDRLDATGSLLAVDVAVGDSIGPPSPVTGFPDGTRAIAAAWSPDGATLAVVSTSRPDAAEPTAPTSDELWLIARDGSQRRFPLPVADDTIGGSRSLRWMADSAHLVIGWQTVRGNPGTGDTYTYWFLVISAEDGALSPNAGWTPGRINEVFPSPDGRLFVYRDAVLQVFDLETGTTLAMPGAFPQGWAGQLVWTP